MIWKNEEILAEDRLYLTGRRIEASDPLRLFWVGSGIHLTAKVCDLFAVIEADWSGHTPWMSVALDGVQVARFALQRGTHRYALLTGMGAEAVHRVSLTRDTQPMEGDEKLLVRFQELELDGELLPQEHRMTIEFIGDSLTSGEGLVGPQSASEWRTVFMSGAKNYAAQVCALLDADGEWVSQSGWGIATDWTGDPRHVLPGIYDRVCALQPAGDQPYAFDAHPVAAVVVNLGTNDMSALNSLTPDERPEREHRIAACVRDFLTHLRQVRPGAPILWVCGMCGDGLNALLERAVADTARTLQDSLMAFLPLPACTAEETGSLSHPGEASHRRCAALIAPALKDLIEKAGVL